MKCSALQDNYESLGAISISILCYFSAIFDIKEFIIIFILGQDKRYTIKYIGEGLYLTVCLEMSPNEDSIFFLEVNMFTSCISLQGRGILEELILSIPFPGRSIFYRRLPRAYICRILPGMNTGCSLYWEKHLSKRALLKK